MATNEVDIPALLERLIRIETSLAHLQHDVDGLNASLTLQYRRLSEMDERFARIEHDLQQAQEPTSPRDPSDERPPHY
ncbi:MAG: SlyX family protein [Planctomyces sp.]|nr:SlyX family protein [Planctomyces sp.]